MHLSNRQHCGSVSQGEGSEKLNEELELLLMSMLRSSLHSIDSQRLSGR